MLMRFEMVHRQDKSLRFNPASPDFHAHIYSIYQHMQTHQPLLRLGRTWIITRYADIYHVLKNKSLLSSGIPDQLHAEMVNQSLMLSPELRTLLYGIVLFEDGEKHSLHRQALQSLFTGEAWASLSALITLETQRLVGEVSFSSSFDGVHDIAAPLWGSVFSRWLNLSAEQQAIVEEEKEAIRLLLDPSAIDEAGLKVLIRALSHLESTFNALLQKHLSGYDSLFFHALVKGYQGNMADLQSRFSTDCITMLIGGSETSEALIGNMLLMMVQQPGLQLSLRENTVSLRDIVTETMRFETPLQMARRKVHSPLEMHGRELRVGDHLLLCLGAANRDGSIFVEPDKFMPGRKNAQKQLGFGAGTHQCIGQLLAQFQAENVARILFEKYSIKLCGDFKWSTKSLILRHLAGLPLST
jgi:hypothetical protein